MILSNRVNEAIDRFVEGDWERRHEVFDLPAQVFRDWAATVELPYGEISITPATLDGWYVLQTDGDWTCFYKERGIVFNERRFPTFEEAKFYALDATVAYGLKLQE